MPLNAINYSETIIYKIVCKDLSIIDIYVGHTTSFKDRKKSHKSKTEKGKEKLYQMIRANGGWENWEMIEIEKYSCNDVNEAKKQERYWYEKLNAKLNIYVPFISKEEHCEKNKIYRDENKKKLSDQHKMYRKTHKENLSEQFKLYYEKHKEEINEKKKENCECICGAIYRIDGKGRHEKTKKHQKYLMTL